MIFYLISFFLNILKAYTYVGCYGSNGLYCRTFVEDGLSSTLCTSAASSYTLNCTGCYQASTALTNYLATSNSMTVELCLRVCNAYGYIYAGLVG